MGSFFSFKFMMTFPFGPLPLVFGAMLFSSAISANSIQFETPLVYIYNIYNSNIAIAKHTIQSVNLSSPMECFRHCAKVCGCVAFQFTGTSCELLDTDEDGAANDLVTSQGTVLYSMQQSGSKVRLC